MGLPCFWCRFVRGFKADMLLHCGCTTMHLLAMLDAKSRRLKINPRWMLCLYYHYTTLFCTTACYIAAAFAMFLVVVRLWLGVVVVRLKDSQFGICPLRPAVIQVCSFVQTGPWGRGISVFNREVKDAFVSTHSPNLHFCYSCQFQTQARDDGSRSVQKRTYFNLSHSCTQLVLASAVAEISQHHLTAVLVCVQCKHSHGHQQMQRAQQ